MKYTVQCVYMYCMVQCCVHVAIVMLQCCVHVAIVMLQCCVHVAIVMLQCIRSYIVHSWSV